MSRLKRLMPTMSSWRAGAQKNKDSLELLIPIFDVPKVYPYQPLLSENHIRLLLLEPLAPSSTQKSQPICATLHQVELDSKTLSTRPYKALSYEWVVRKKENGDELDVHEEQNLVNPTILLDGHTVHIGENLYNALKSIRHLKGEIGGSDLWLWVDALCINQSDVQERGHQVRLMKRIYETAEMVLVWLGMGNDLTHLATKVLNLEANELQDRVVRERLERDELHGIRQICEMGYWRRVWILQEVVLARNYMVICNQDFVTMERFEKTLVLLCKHTWKTKLREFVLWLPESPAQEITALRSSRGTASSLIEWVRICVRCRFGATDPRDYVYALLGISDDCEGKIEPDFSRSAEEVYSSAIAVIVNKAEGYNEILCGSFAELMGLRWSVGRAVWEEVCGGEVEERVLVWARTRRVDRKVGMGKNYPVFKDMPGMAASLYALRYSLPLSPVALEKKVDLFSERLRFRVQLLTGHRHWLLPEPEGGPSSSKGTTTTSLVVLMAEPHWNWCLPTGLPARSRHEIHPLDQITQAALDQVQPTSMATDEPSTTPRPSFDSNWPYPRRDHPTPRHSFVSSRSYTMLTPV